MKLVQNFSPRCPVAPSFMFSSTVSSESAFVSWNVRTCPMRATLNEGMPDSVVPSNDHVPELGLSKPHSRLNSVVFPAPFGPMRAVMAFARDLEVIDVDGGEAAESAGHVVHDHDRVDLGHTGDRLALGEPVVFGRGCCR